MLSLYAKSLRMFGASWRAASRRIRQPTRRLADADKIAIAQNFASRIRHSHGPEPREINQHNTDGLWKTGKDPDRPPWRATNVMLF
jgi:hypothetical protein